MTTETVEKSAATKKTKGAEKDAVAIELPQLPKETMLVPIVGTAPLVVHKFSEKAKRQMLDAMQGRKNPKQSKNPEEEYLAAFYHIWKTDGQGRLLPEIREGVRKTDGYGFPVIAFKSATIGGARFYQGVTMTALRQFMFFKGETGDGGQEMARIEGSTPVMREDVVRVNRGGTDLRYRPMFEEWATTLQVTYIKSALTRDSVLALIDAGGMGVGVGEWRVEKDGAFGTFKIDTSRDIEVLG